jgi:diguanylate cyclase (GGDEF)-like protein
MADDSGHNLVPDEEIEGAPPVVTQEELRQQRLMERVSLNKYLYQQGQQFEYMLLEARDLSSLLEAVLVSMPRHFSFRSAELWLYDPEGVLAGLVRDGQRLGPQLQFHQDSFTMQELYDLEPDIVLIDATDTRMFEVLKSEQGIDYALLLPLMEAGRMVGSLHLGLQDAALISGEAEQDMVVHLSQVISACIKNAIAREVVSQLTLLDPLTHISNLRGFEKDIAREIARARRADKPVSVLVMEVDDFDELYDHYGKRRGRFVLKKVAERISSDLRATDMLARLSRSRLAVLIPGSGEVLARDIAERMRNDIDDFAIDDGRGAVLHVTLSVGLVTWEPQQYPAVDMPHLAKQMESVGVKALNAARSGGGNRVAVSRLSTLMV